MKPIIIIPPGDMSREDIDRLNANDLCVVEAKDPATVKFVDPLPAISSRTEIEHAAIQLSRRMLAGQFGNNLSVADKKDVATLFYQLLTQGTPLSSGPTQQEIERKIYESAKADELRELAKQEAREERAKARAEKKK